MKVEFIYDSSCPHVDATRENLRRALRAANAPVRWTEWERSAPDCPEGIRGYGSPTVLVDGRDVAGQDPADANCCRLYSAADGRLAGAPTPEMIQRAIPQSLEPPRAALRQTLGVVPGAGIALLPKLACPLCWPAYASLLTSVGAGFLVSGENLMALTGLLLLGAVGVLLLRAQERRGYGPAVLGAGAAVVVMAGRFGLDSEPAAYAGLGVLVAASIWNSWPRSRCGTCVPGGACEAETHYMP